MKKPNEEHDKGTVKHYFDLSDLGNYFFRKKDPNKKINFNLRMMHGINKFSIIVFLIALIVWLIKRFV